MFICYQELYIIPFDFSRHKDSWAHRRKEAKRLATAICSDHKGQPVNSMLNKAISSQECLLVVEVEGH